MEKKGIIGHDQVEFILGIQGWFNIRNNDSILENLLI